MGSQGQHQASVRVTMCREKWASVHTRCKTVNACFTGWPSKNRTFLAGLTPSSSNACAAASLIMTSLGAQDHDVSNVSF